MPIHSNTYKIYSQSPKNFSKVPPGYYEFALFHNIIQSGKRKYKKINKNTRHLSGPNIRASVMAGILSFNLISQRTVSPPDLPVLFLETSSQNLLDIFFVQRLISFKNSSIAGLLCHYRNILVADSDFRER